MPIESCLVHSEALAEGWSSKVNGHPRAPSVLIMLKHEITNPNANGVHKKEVMRKNPIFALKMCSRVVHVTNFLMFC